MTSGTACPLTFVYKVLIVAVQKKKKNPDSGTDVATHEIICLQEVASAVANAQYKYIAPENKSRLHHVKETFAMYTFKGSQYLLLNYISQGSFFRQDKHSLCATSCTCVLFLFVSPDFLRGMMGRYSSKEILITCNFNIDDTIKIKSIVRQDKKSCLCQIFAKNYQSKL